jgi:pimeloyl-ACP methyl ester carboxylesterase
MGGVFSSPLNDAVFPRTGRPHHNEKKLREEYGFHTVGNIFSIKEIPGDKTLVSVCLHGNLEVVSNSVPQWGFLCNARAIIGLEYPGYGMRGDEEASEQSILAEIPRWIHALDDSGFKKNIVVCGRSLGSFVAIHLAISLGERCAGLVLVSPMLTAIATKIKSPWYRIGSAFDLLDNETAASKLSEKIPVLLIHGEKDTVVPEWNSEELYLVLKRRRNAYVRREVIKNCGHNNLMGERQVREIVQSFFYLCEDRINGRDNVPPSINTKVK